jgi:hypothetical protein
VIRAKNAFDGARYSSTPAVTGSCATGAMTFDGAMARLAKVVKGSKHLANDAMLRLLLGMSSVGRPADIPAVVHFNSMLDKVSECDCSTFLVTSFKDRSPRLRIGRFLVGTVDVEKMKYRCKKIECDFFERYPDRYRFCYGVEQDPKKIRIIDLSRLPSPNVSRTILETIETEYFDLISLKMFSQCVEEFEEDALAANAVGASLLNLRDLLLISNGSIVCIYMYPSNRRLGHFRPIGVRNFIEFRPPESEIASSQAALLERFSFSAFDNSQVHQTLRSFCKLVTRARQHRSTGAVQDAFLHCVIALDLIFGDRDASARSFANRLAVVTAGRLTKPVEETRTLIDRIYDSRSKYVHRGLNAPEEHLEAVWSIVGAVLETLFELQANSHERAAISIQTWLRKIDHLYMALAADERPSEAKFLENGLIPPPADQSR